MMRKTIGIEGIRYFYKVVPLRHNLLYLFESFHDLFRQNLGVDLCGLDVGMTKHLAYHFNRYAGAEGNGSGEGVSADMGCEVLVNACVLVDACQESSVVREAYLGEFP